MDKQFLFLKNGSAAPLSELPELGFDQFRSAVISKVREACRVMAFFAMPEEEKFRLIVILGNKAEQGFELSSTLVGNTYPALTPDAPAFHWFEREIAEQYGIVPAGHPWLKPLRFHSSYSGNDAWGRKAEDEILPGVTDYFTMGGEAVHEVAVGPVHAGVIEPGHFRFQCMGEDVYSLEIELGYQHRGIEKMLIGGPDKKSIHFMETAAGDTTVASATNYAQIMEALGDVELSRESRLLRAVALELERLANHIGDLGALAGDVAFLPTASFCGRIRGEYLNMTAELCGNRFGRNLIVPGGTRFGLEVARAQKVLKWIERVYPELRQALDMLFDSPTVLDRFENTGSVSQENAADCGLIGVAGRASGVDVDARHDFPADTIARPVKVACGKGDVVSRARVRYDEIIAAHDWIIPVLEKITEYIPARQTECVPAASSIAVSVTEAWRGELCHAAVTDANGKFRRYKIVDPSFHNWFGLALALRNEQISNFPICNKSFSLSYCGHDL